MSQPLPPKAGEKDDPGPPLGGRDDLIEWYQSAGKPRDAFRVGTEHEKFGFLREDNSPLPFDGPRGIEAIFKAIANDAEEPGWTPVEDRGRVVALLRDNASITLEPGGQLELSGAPLQSLFDTCNETGGHLKLLRRVCKPLNVGFIGIGFHPTASYADMPDVPKSRYGIMSRHMPTVGERGLDMMKRTCTVQANFDWSDEADMVSAFRTALAISPLVTALFANSPFVDGKPSGHLSERALVWSKTDPERCGYPECVFEDGFGYERWVDWLLDVPMYFIRRDGVHHDYAGQSFRTFMTEGIDGMRATWRDWDDHLTVSFPEVRVKRYLEVRGADCGPWSRISALPAVWKGILYDADAKAQAWEMMESPTAPELRELHLDVAKRGFAAQYRGQSVQALCKKLLRLSRAGLDRQAEPGERSESTFLEDLEDEVERGQTFAEWLLELYETRWGRDINQIYNELEFWE